MLAAEDGGLFINPAKLDLRKYATRPPLAKALFLYMLHVTNDTLRAAELAAFATEHEDFKDWWWKGLFAARRVARTVEYARPDGDHLMKPPALHLSHAWVCLPSHGPLPRRGKTVDIQSENAADNRRLHAAGKGAPSG
jgi:hypothetical protein